MSQTQTADKAQWPDVNALSNWMQANVEGFSGTPALSKFEGGQSNQTFRVSSESGKYVLRRKPAGPVLSSAHAVDREFKVLTAMRTAGIPVPKVYALCTDESVIGSMFYIMDFVPGRVFWDPRLPDLTKTERAGIFDSMNETIARIHRLDPDEIGLEDFGRKEDYLKRQISRWTRQYEAARIGENENMERLIEWLPKQWRRDWHAVHFRQNIAFANIALHC